MAMIRGANDILTRTVCVNDVDLGVTWSSNKGSMVHGEEQHMAMPQASSIRNSGVGYAHKFGVATPFRVAFPCISRCMRSHLHECGCIPWGITGS